MVGRIRDVALIAVLAIALNVELAGSWLYGIVIALAELLFLGLLLVASLYVRP